MLSRLRALINEADPEVVEEWKWRGTPVWSHNGLICNGETYEKVVKMTFAKGASLDDPSGLFNASLEGNARRAIDFREGEKLDEEALKALIRAAVALNKSSARGESARYVAPLIRKTEVMLLSGIHDGRPRAASGRGRCGQHPRDAFLHGVRGQ